MNKDILQKAILIPVITGLALCALFFFAASISIDELLPINSGTVLAYHDQKADEVSEFNDDVAPPVWGHLSDNRNIGYINEMPLRYNADYSALLDSASVMPGSSAFNETGCAYIKIINSNAEKFGNTIKLDSDFGNAEYKYSYDFSANNEPEILQTAPKGMHSVIIYMRASDGIGIKGEYYAMVYEEVA